MDKAQALHDFWSSFGIPAFDESTVPEKIWDEELQKEVELKPPYITYAVAEGSLDGIILLSASVWYHGYGWSEMLQRVLWTALFCFLRVFGITAMDGAKSAEKSLK